MKRPSEGSYAPRPNAACECGHPYSEHYPVATKNRECAAYDPLNTKPWCTCEAFRIVQGRYLVQERIPETEIRAAEIDRNKKIVDNYEIPLRWRPTPALTKKPEQMATREWSRYDQAQIDRKARYRRYDENALLADAFGNDDFKTNPILMPSATKALEYFSKAMLDKVFVEKPSRKSKTAPKKAKPSKKAAAVNKLHLTRVPPTDEEV